MLLREWARCCPYATCSRAVFAQSRRFRAKAVTSIYSNSRDFPKEKNPKTLTDLQQQKHLSANVLIWRGGWSLVIWMKNWLLEKLKRRKFRPVDDIKSEILRWKPEYIINWESKELPPLISSCEDLNAVIQDRADNQQYSFTDIHDYAEYIKPMLITEAFVQARIGYQSMSSPTQLRMQVGSVTTNNKAGSLQLVVKCVGTFSADEYNDMTQRLRATGNKFGQDSLFLLSGLRFAEDDQTTALVKDWVVKPVGNSRQQGSTAWDPGAEILYTPITSCMKNLVVSTKLIVFDKRLIESLTEFETMRPNAGDYIRMTYVADLRALVRQTKCLTYLLQSPLLPSLLNPSAHEHTFTLPQMEAKPPIENGAHLNESQLRVIHDVSNDVIHKPNKARVCLVHGPPGTGKSHTILRLIQTLINTKQQTLSLAKSDAPSTTRATKSSSPSAKANVQKAKKANRPIMLCASSNNALDNVLMAIIKHNQSKTKKISILRVGLEESVHPVVLPYYLRDNEGLLTGAQKKVNISEFDVIGVTIGSSSRSTLDRFSNLGVMCVIVDEACQATEIDLMAMLRFRSSKLILFGDPLQLQPTVIAPQLLATTYPISLFSRCVHQLTGGHSTSFCKQAYLLDIQYRMEPAIAHFPSKHVYQGRLMNGKSSAVSYYPFKPYLVFNVIKSRERAGYMNIKSKMNVAEADLLAGLCRLIVNGSRITVNNIGVITFYADQVSLLQRILHSSGLSEVEVNTVDGFQGREKDVIILSCVRSEKLGFVCDLKRMNVAITRARCGLYVLGNAKALQRASNSWRELLNDAGERSLMVDVEKVHELKQHMRASVPVHKKQHTSSG